LLIPSLQNLILEAQKPIEHLQLQHVTTKSQSLGSEMLLKSENESKDIPDILNYYQVIF